MKDQFHNEFYSFAKYYDIAFDFKDISQECDFIAELCEKHQLKKPQSFIEFAAGPALHAIEFAKRGVRSTAVDLSPEMTAYGLAKAAEAGLSLQYECADMIRYQSAAKYDVAAILMDSVAYLVTNEAVIAHLQSVASVLNPGGLYILEMAHPRSVFNIAASTVNDWQMEKDGITVDMKWGAESDVFDPITQVTQTSVRLQYKDGARSGVIEEKAPIRCFTATEWDALVQAADCFEIVGWYGAMKTAQPFTNDKAAWRMVPVLKKRS